MNSSTYQRLGLPDALAMLLVNFLFILALVPYLANTDFGLFNIPAIPRAEAALRWVGPIAFGISLLLFVPLWPKPVSRAERGRALILGYDAAFALAHASMGSASNQDIASVNEHLRLLGLDKVEFPRDPIGPKRDGGPAAEFAREVAGVLAARSRIQERAFLLGWFGVISSNTRSVCPQGFSVRGFAKEAGFKDEPNLAEPQYLETLVASARRNL